MKSDWKKNKIGHEKYWGQLYNWLIENSSKYSNLEEEFLALNNFEMKGNAPQFKHEGKLYNGDCDTYSLVKQNILYNLISSKIDGADYLVDLGSGWGRNSISYSMKDPNQKIIAGELSDSGKNVTKSFIKKYNLPIESIPFNFFDFGYLIEYLRHKNVSKVMLFSFHAIEQADFLKKEDFIKLLDLPIKFKAIHFEPVAWQYKGQKFPFGNHYNQNFKDVLDSLEKDRILEVNNINHTHYNCNTNTGGRNSTLIEWEKL